MENGFGRHINVDMTFETWVNWRYEGRPKDISFFLTYRIRNSLVYGDLISVLKFFILLISKEDLEWITLAVLKGMKKYIQ